METSTMKVKVHCCKSCQRKAKKILEQADGVQSICLDISEGLLTVTGNIEPFRLIEMVEKEISKGVELWSFRRYPVKGGNDGRHDTTKEADLRGARDRKKAARRRADRERAGHADPGPASPHRLRPEGYPPMAGPCPPGCYGPPQFPPPYHWYYPMPPMQPPPPYYYHHEAQQPKQ